MIENKRETGAKYEELAAQYLVNSGYKIIELNYRIKTGEIDIIASDINTIVFCEVKYRRTNQYGYPEEAVNYIKQSKIRKTATDDDIRLSLKRVGLETDIKVKKFSLGMKQRLNIAQAIFEHQNIIMLDEPTNALDDKGVKLIYDIIREERERGAFVLISTHHKEDLKETCDIILNVSEGMISED